MDEKLFIIDKIKDNAGKGNPVFSRPGLLSNQQFKAFQPMLPARKPEIKEIIDRDKDKLVKRF